MTKRNEKAKKANRKTANPNLTADYCVDTALDTAIKYGTAYPKSDKNDYSKPMREYKKNS